MKHKRVNLRELAENPSLRRGIRPADAADKKEATPSPEEMKMEPLLKDQNQETLTTQSAVEPKVHIIGCDPVTGQRVVSASAKPSIGDEKAPEDAEKTGALAIGTPPPAELAQLASPPAASFDGAAAPPASNGNSGGSAVAVIRTLKLADIGRRAEVRPVNNDVVNEYAGAMKAGARFPLPRVFEDLNAPEAQELERVDGGHRLEAMKLLQILEAECLVEPGTLDDAKLAAAGCNQTHGLRRTNADKRRAVAVVYSIHPDWTENRIATHCGVSPSTVASVVAEQDIADPEAKEKAGPRKAADGRVFQNKTRDKRSAPTTAETGASKSSPTPVVNAGESAPPPSAAGVAEPAAVAVVPKEGIGSQPTDPNEVVPPLADAEGSQVTATERSANSVVAPAALAAEAVADAVVAQPTGDTADATVTRPNSDESQATDLIDFDDNVGAKIRIPYVLRGEAMEAVCEVDNNEQGLPAELVYLRSFIRNTVKLHLIKVPRSVLAAILTYVMHVE